MKKLIILCTLIACFASTAFSATPQNILLIDPKISQEAEQQLLEAMRIESTVRTEVLEAKHIEAFYMEKRTSGRLIVQMVGSSTFETANIKRLLERAGVKDYLVRLVATEEFTELDALDAVIQASERLGEPLNEDRVALAREEFDMRSFSKDSADIVETLEERVLKRAQELKRDLLPEEIEELYDELVRRGERLLPEEWRHQLIDWMERAQSSMHEGEDGLKEKVVNWFNKLIEGDWIQKIKDFFDQLMQRMRGQHGLERT
ncbi:MAG TPA: hypothetical protein GX733_03570 [Tissierellia bacterium]|nr:hypothetical protein [Tissierellia bacterium]